MILLAFFIGSFTTILGALPPGASNLAVIKTTLQESRSEALKVIYGAGVGEMFLALVAFSSGMIVQDFFEMNLWIQYSIAALLAITGLYFLLSKKKNNQKVKKRKSSKYLLGLTLSIVNPPVLIYWILIFSLLGKYMLIEQRASLAWVVLFLVGVFVGKVATLYGYSTFGLHVQKKKKSEKNHLNKFIGITLLLLSVMQIVKLLFL